MIIEEALRELYRRIFGSLPARLRYKEPNDSGMYEVQRTQVMREESSVCSKELNR